MANLFHYSAPPQIIARPGAGGEGAGSEKELPGSSGLRSTKPVGYA